LGKAWSHWATVCKAVRPMLSDRCLSCLFVCDVSVLWPNGWMDQDSTWCGGRPRPRPHSVRWGPSFPQKGHSTHLFSAHVYCGQTAVWIKMPLGTKAGFRPGLIVLHGDLAPSKAHSPPIFGPCIWPNGRPSQLLLRTFTNGRPKSNWNQFLLVAKATA